MKTKVYKRKDSSLMAVKCIENILFVKFYLILG